MDNLKKVALMRKLRSFGFVLASIMIIAVCTLASSTAAAVTASKTTAAGVPTKRTAPRSAAQDLTPLPIATTLTLGAAPTAVWLRTNSTFSGTLSTTATTSTPSGPVANESVQVQVSTNNTSWTTLTSVITDANGMFTTPVTIVNASAQYRAVFAGDPSYAPSQSTDVTVSGFKATTKIFLTSPTQVKAENYASYVVHYAVYDSRVSSRAPVAGASVDISRKDIYGGDWVRVTTVTTNASGDASWKAAVSTPTQWKISAHATGTTIAPGSVYYTPRVVPAGVVYSLPGSAPKPTYLSPQPAAVGEGANPVVTDISNAVWNDMVGKSWHAGCPIGRGQLLYMTVNYWGFDGYRHRGELVFRASQRAKYVSAFTRIYYNHIPLHGMYRVDRFGYSSVTHGANDYASMQHDNTSAFNCRWVDGSPGTLSPHAYGTAVDINPYENPYHSARGWTPNVWWRNHSQPPYTWRSRSASLVQAMLNAGFHWTYGNEDSQHFDT